MLATMVSHVPPKSREISSITDATDVLSLAVQNNFTSPPRHNVSCPLGNTTFTTGCWSGEITCVTSDEVLGSWHPSPWYSAWTVWVPGGSCVVNEYDA